MIDRPNVAATSAEVVPWVVIVRALTEVVEDHMGWCAPCHMGNPCESMDTLVGFVESMERLDMERRFADLVKDAGDSGD